MRRLSKGQEFVQDGVILDQLRSSWCWRRATCESLDEPSQDLQAPDFTKLTVRGHIKAPYFHPIGPVSAELKARGEHPRCDSTMTLRPQRKPYCRTKVWSAVVQKFPSGLTRWHSSDGGQIWNRSTLTLHTKYAKPLSRTVSWKCFGTLEKHRNPKASYQEFS